MRRSLPFSALASLTLTALAALAALTTAACSSSTPPPEQPGQTSDTPGSTGAKEESQKWDGTSEQADSTPEPSGTPSSGQGDESNRIPDDYTMMSGDCALLGKKLGSVVRSDHMAQLSPKLSEDRRAAAEQNIDDVASKMGEQWRNGCESSLVGKVVERERLKCALDARSLKAFEECINPPAPKN